MCFGVIKCSCELGMAAVLGSTPRNFLPQHPLTPTPAFRLPALPWPHTAPRASPPHAHKKSAKHCMLCLPQPGACCPYLPNTTPRQRSGFQRKLFQQGMCTAALTNLAFLPHISNRPTVHWPCASGAARAGGRASRQEWLYGVIVHTASWQVVLAGQRGLVGKQWAPQRQSQIAQGSASAMWRGQEVAHLPDHRPVGRQHVPKKRRRAVPEVPWGAAVHHLLRCGIPYKAGGWGGGEGVWQLCAQARWAGPAGGGRACVLRHSGLHSGASGGAVRGSSRRRKRGGGHAVQGGAPPVNQVLGASLAYCTGWVAQCLRGSGGKACVGGAGAATASLTKSSSEGRSIFQAPPSHSLQPQGLSRSTVDTLSCL